MLFTETPLKGAFRIELDRMEDDRGFFARAWCEKEFKQHGLNPRLVQCNISFNERRGTLRGMHYQEPPFAEAKLVRCTQGTLYDAIVDLRTGSPTFRQSYGAVLSAANRNMLYIPEGCAHGFLTLADHTEVFYQMSQFYSSEHSRGVRWNDPKLEIAWPEAVKVISERDRTFPDLP